MGSDPVSSLDAAFSLSRSVLCRAQRKRVSDGKRPRIEATRVGAARDGNAHARCQAALAAAVRAGRAQRMPDRLRGSRLHSDEGWKDGRTWATEVTLLCLDEHYLDK